PRPTSSPLFPYTTLFRSKLTSLPERAQVQWWERSMHKVILRRKVWKSFPNSNFSEPFKLRVAEMAYYVCQRRNNYYTLFFQKIRSEEHTSELQSRENLVC